MYILSQQMCGVFHNSVPAVFRIAPQATSDPRLEPIPPMPPTPVNPNPRPSLGPPYPIDEGSFLDTCKRLGAVADAFVGLSADGGGGGYPGRTDQERSTDGGVADPALAEMLTRSLGCLASFRWEAAALRSEVEVYFAANLE